jgi:hypothetical protein
VIPPDASGEFVADMEEVLETYEKAYDPAKPVVCMDEQSVQLMGERACRSRPPQEVIDGCLTALPTKYQGRLATLLTHNFQMWENVSILNAQKITNIIATMLSLTSARSGRCVK